MIESYLRLVEDTEPPTNFHRWSFLTCVAACLGRKVRLKFGNGYIYPNMYTVLVGAPGTRKSTALKVPVNMLKLGGMKNFSATKTSKQKFLLDWEASLNEGAASSFLEELASEEPVNNMFIAVEELLDFLGPSNFDFINLLTTMWDNLSEYEERLKNSKSTKILNPTINILAGLTPVGLQMALPPESAGTGILSRIMLVYSEPTKTRIAWPEAISDEDNKKFSEFFSSLRITAGDVEVTKEAKEFLAEIYNSWHPLEDARLQYYCSRRYTHLLKLCMVVAAYRGSILEITKDIALEANTILTYTEHSMHMALGEFGKSKHSDASQAIIQHLEHRNAPVNGQELFKVVHRSVEKFGDFVEILRNLLRAERIQCADGMYIAKVRKVNTFQNFVDFPKYIPENPTNTHAYEKELELPTEEISNEPFL